MDWCNKDVKNYSTGFKYLHWLVAVLVLGMLGLGFFLADLPKEMKVQAYMLHKSIGLTILCLMLVRVVWIVLSGKPKLPDATPKWEGYLASLVQYGLYLFLISMALSGWLMATASNKIPVYFNWFSVPFPGLSPNEKIADWMYSTHGVIAWILLGLVGLHIAGALKHWLIQKDDVLTRMMP
ncbi:MAG: cytochrome b [Gammaproteobacteria bacterium]|nr:cytochrome b [Gammaproteobacteria bacterium]MCH9716609.1 cytochrome b [Gammaproteobacteria bacterium]MCH9762791.1 cytochrome b [Gammaproteobacteria bacterium]